MVRRRIGNDIDIEWSVFRGDAREDFTGKILSLYIIERCGKKQKVDNTLITTSGNTIYFTWKAGNQYSVGNYSLVLEEYLNNELCNTVDITDAIELVANTALENGDADYISDESVEFRSDFEVVFNSINKAFAAAANADAKADRAINESNNLNQIISVAEDSYNKLKELLEEDIIINIGGNGHSYFTTDENGDLVPKPKEDGSPRGIYTDSFISSGGLNEETGGSEGGIAEVTIKFGDVEPNQEGYKTDDNGIIILPNYPTVEDIDLSKYLTIEDAANSYASKQDVNEFKALFNSMFIKVDDGNGNVSIKALLGLWSDSFISSGGLNDDITSGSVINSLGDINDVTITSPTNGQVLTYRDGVWVNEAMQGGGDMSGYLPLSGGTMQGDIVLPSGYYIRTGNGWNYAMLGVDGDKVLIGTHDYHTQIRSNTTPTAVIGGTEHTLIHSGNIGSYAPIYNSSGYVGIGTTNPSYSLDIYRENQGDLLRLNSNTTYACAIFKPSSGSQWSVGCNTNSEFYFYNNTAKESVVTIKNGGRITSNGMLFRDVDKPNGYNPTYMSEIYQWQDSIFFTRNNPTTGAFLQSVASINLATGVLSSSGASFGGNVYLRDTTGSASTSFKLWFVRRTSTDDYWDYGIYAQSTKGLTICQSNQGVNTDIAWLDGYGNLYATGGVTARYASSSSDAKLKDNIALLSQEDAINILMALKPSSWNWKDGGKLAYGLIAQDVESVLPCSVTYGEHLSLQYNMFHAFEISVAQNHETRIKQLEAELAKLRREYYGNR